MNYIKTLGDLVKAGRIQMGLTQSELAHEMGLALRTVADIENYDANPRFDTLCTIIDYMNLQDIFHAEDSESKKSTLLAVINQELSYFTEEDLAVAVKVIEGLRKGLYPKNPE
ncbi:MAG: helix-turn-helix domain-containing protein [Eubacteriales bacterium]|nr:helix-turn-helix domain-containing protein [Eubacteriales bacterium]